MLSIPLHQSPLLFGGSFGRARSEALLSLMFKALSAGQKELKRTARPGCGQLLSEEASAAHRYEASGSSGTGCASSRFPAPRGTSTGGGGGVGGGNPDTNCTAGCRYSRLDVTGSSRPELPIVGPSRRFNWSPKLQEVCRVGDIDRVVSPGWLAGSQILESENSSLFTGALHSMPLRVL